MTTLISHAGRKRHSEDAAESKDTRTSEDSLAVRHKPSKAASTVKVQLLVTVCLLLAAAFLLLLYKGEVQQERPMQLLCCIRVPALEFLHYLLECDLGSQASVSGRARCLEAKCLLCRLAGRNAKFGYPDRKSCDSGSPLCWQLCTKAGVFRIVCT